MPDLPQIVADAKTKWSLAGTVKRRWFVYALGVIVGFLAHALLF